MVFEHLAGDERDIDDLRPVDARHRVEVDAKLVGVIEVFGAHGMRIEVEAAEVHDPRQSRGIPDHRLFGGGAGGVVQGGGVDEGGMVLGDALLEERLLVEALREPLEHHRPAAGPAEGALGDREVIAHEVELGEARLGEDDAVRARDAHLVAVDVEDLGRRLRGAHGARLAPGRRRAAPLAAGYRVVAGLSSVQETRVIFRGVRVFWTLDGGVQAGGVQAGGDEARGDEARGGGQARRGAPAREE